MEERMKWLLAGVGVMYAVQLAVLLVIRYVLPQSGSPEVYNLMSTMLYTLVSFLVGGFVIGLMSERILIIETALAALTALLIDVLTSQAGWLEGLFLFSLALREEGYGIALVIGATAIIAAVAGALAGERQAVPREDWVSQGLLVVGLVGLLLGPFLLMGAYLPLSYLIPFGLAVLAGILFAAYRYGTAPRRVDRLSIRPQSHPSPERRAS